MTYSAAHSELLKLADPDKAVFLSRFFKTGKGEYGEGDQFLGITVPSVRALAKRFGSLTFSEIEYLIRSPYNEERFFGLVILQKQFQKGSLAAQTKTYRFYMRNLDWVNNWNLVDASAPYIIGAYLLNRPRTPLYKLVQSENLWRRRIAILSTFPMIRIGDFDDALNLIRILLNDEQDLIHKACGWMLREIGKVNLAILEMFLNKNYSQMPRTMLRYAIERLPTKKRQAYLKGRVSKPTKAKLSLGL